MEKKDLLQSIGFSNEFIDKLNEFENNDSFNFKPFTFSNESFDYTVKDTSELYFEKQENKDTNKLIVK